jgi:hypothetical protein
MGYNDHGYVLANIARKYSCDNDGDCVADIHTRLGLHLQMDGSGNIVPNVTDGGDFGSIAFVAKAVRDEVADWSGDNPLILNLSIGWDPDWGGALTSMSTWPLSVRAMYDALEDAACRGVMITVASGNRLGGPPPDDQPLYPAGWGTAQLSVPTCTTQLGAASAVRILTGDPLLYPVGGVDAYGERLVLSRSNSHPKLVAYGNHAVVRDSSSNPTTILTGHLRKRGGGVDRGGGRLGQPDGRAARPGRVDVVQLRRARDAGRRAVLVPDRMRQGEVHRRVSGGEVGV